jgi:hypothetical protein
MAFLKKLAICLTATGLACERAPTIVELSDERILVHSVLLGGMDSVSVIVARANVDDAMFDQRPHAVTNATVGIRTGDQVIILQRGGSCLRTALSAPGDSLPFEGCYSAIVPGGIRHNTRYDLEITVPGHPLITGTTVVPHAISVIQPQRGQRIVVSENRTDSTAFASSWSGATGESVRVQIVSHVPNCEILLQRQDDQSFGVELILRAGATESPSLVPRRISCFASPPEFNGTFAVTSLDASYEAYLASRDNSLRPDEASVGLVGAFGFFGSAAIAKQPVTLVRD